MKTWLVTVMTTAALVMSAAADDAKAAPQVIRTILEKHHLSDIDKKEAVTTTAGLPTGSSVAFHTHPRDEVGVVIKGSIVLTAPRRSRSNDHAGQSFFSARGLVHSVVAGPDGGSILSTCIVDKGVQMLSPAP